MRINSPNRRIPALTSMGIFFLAIAVFGWGIKYKLSLYDAPGSFSTHITQAKLLSQKERPVRDGVVDSAHAASPMLQSSFFYPALFAVALIFGLHLVAALHSATITVDDSRQQRCASSSFFSFRPPPPCRPDTLSSPRISNCTLPRFGECRWA
jgi:hypothetical protein